MKHNGLTILKRFVKENDNIRKEISPFLHNVDNDTLSMIVNGKISLWSYAYYIMTKTNIRGEENLNITREWYSFLDNSGYYDKLMYNKNGYRYVIAKLTKKRNKND